MKSGKSQHFIGFLAADDTSLLGLCASFSAEIMPANVLRITERGLQNSARPVGVC